VEYEFPGTDLIENGKLGRIRGNPVTFNKPRQIGSLSRGHFGVGKARFVCQPRLCERFSPGYRKPKSVKNVGHLLRALSLRYRPHREAP